MISVISFFVLVSRVSTSSAHPLNTFDGMTDLVLGLALMAFLVTLMYHGAAKLASIVVADESSCAMHQTGCMLQRVLDRVVSQTCSANPAVTRARPDRGPSAELCATRPPPFRTARRPAGLASRGCARVVVLLTALGCFPGAACQVTISPEVTSQPASALAAPAAAPAFPPPTPEAPCCLPDGSVRLDGQIVNATRRCVRAQPPADDGMCAADCPEAMRLASIRAGRIDKRQLELVVVRGAKEDLSWSDAYAAVRTVYCHGACDTPGAIELRNVGREAHVYLHHLVSRYDSLAERTVFMQGREPSCGFWGGPVLGGHLLLNVSVADYMAPELGETFMPVTILLGRRLDRHSLRSTFTPTPSAATVLRPPSPMPLGRDGDHWLPWEANNFQQFIRDMAARKSTSPSPMIEFNDFFYSIFDRSPPRILRVAQGAQFAASRAALRRVPLATLRLLFELVELGHAELPYYMEMIWLYLLQPETLDSTLDGTVPPTVSPTLPFLHHLGARHLSLSPDVWPRAAGEQGSLFHSKAPRW